MDHYKNIRSKSFGVCGVMYTADKYGEI